MCLCWRREPLKIRTRKSLEAAVGVSHLDGAIEADVGDDGEVVSAGPPLGGALDEDAVADADGRHGRVASSETV